MTDVEPLKMTQRDDSDGQQEHQSDAQLASLIAQGDRAAAGELVVRYQRPVRSFLLKLSGSTYVADDIAQETFVRVFKYAKRYDPQFKMITWLLTIARRLWLNQLRRKDNQTRNTSYELMSESSLGPAMKMQRKDQLDHTRKLLSEAMTHLTEPQRTALVLFHQQELPVGEVAKVMKMPEGTVKSHLHRARAALRKILQPQMEVTES
ncbi:RNA polymerase sigma factor [bacterium AH-315-I18]|nr:RNA polymerase sigma factor [Phycisphaeraceae bacterium]MBN4061059.1 RNA polymerase sigma factor [bacterium AH-315-I18]